MTFSVKKIEVTPIDQNCRLFINDQTLECLVIDPGGDVKKISNTIISQNLKPLAVLLTHSHFDHCGGVAGLIEIYNIPLYAHALEKDFRSRVEDIVSMYGMHGSDMENCPEPLADNYLTDGQMLKISDFELKVLFTPGHSPGHVCFYHEAMGLLFAGDTVFKQSVGRTDLPMGNHETLIKSIKSKILTLPAHTKILPGHGDDTSVEAESINNPFL